MDTNVSNLAVKPMVQWTRCNGKPCLKFTFGRLLTEEYAVAAISEWQRAFRNMKDDRIEIIWDASVMTAYETNARKAWQRALKEMKTQIGTIWLISQSPVIRMGASMMSVFSSLDIKVVSSERDIFSSSTDQGVQA